MSTHRVCGDSSTRLRPSTSCASWFASARSESVTSNVFHRLPPVVHGLHRPLALVEERARPGRCTTSGTTTVFIPAQPVAWFTSRKSTRGRRRRPRLAWVSSASRAPPRLLQRPARMWRGPPIPHPSRQATGAFESPAVIHSGGSPYILVTAELEDDQHEIWTIFSRQIKPRHIEILEPRRSLK